MSAVYDYLVQCKTELQAITELDTVAIGIERGIGAKDAPFARIVPLTHSPSGTGSALRFQVVFGFDAKNRDYEQLHAQYFDMEESIIRAIRRTGGFWESTVTDEDSVPNMKAAVIIFKNEDVSC